MSKTVYIFVNGIMTLPGCSDNWNSKAVTHFILRAQFAEKLEYFTAPFLTRRLLQKRRAAKLRLKLQYYTNEDWNIILVGHSNGGDVILDTLKDAGWPRIKAIHFIAGACEADFGENGLNDAMRTGRIGEVFVHIGERDIPLKLAGTLLGMISGYGQLGRTGPMRVHPGVDNRVHVKRYPEYGHSTFFSDENFESTMGEILFA